MLITTIFSFFHNIFNPSGTNPIINPRTTSNLMKNGKKFTKFVENIVGKGEIPERVCRRQFQIWWKWQKVLQMGKKTLWEKEKLLITSNFSFSHSVFKRLVPHTRKIQGLFGKGLNNFICHLQILQIRTSIQARLLVKGVWLPGISSYFILYLNSTSILNSFPHDKI